MKRRKDRWNSRLNGSVRTERIPRNTWDKTKADHAIKAKYKIRWEPPYQVARQLPEGFALEFECWVGKDGIRRFLPAKPLPAFVFEASLAGHAILVDRDKEEQSELSHCEARLFNQFARCIREYLGETIKLGRLLNLSRAGRPDAGTKDILPEDIGVNPDGSGERWNVAQFKEIGCQAAKAAGIANPTPDEIAWFALYEAAKRNPLRTSDGEAEDLMKVAFYTLGPEGTKVDEAAIVYVAKQVRASLKDHLNDSTEEFEQWIKDPKSNLITRVSKRKDCQWTKEEVRRAMLELGWRSFKRLAECIDACMRTVASALPKRLTNKEKRLFARIYLAHQDLGRIPLVFLQDRFEVIGKAILEIWRNPGSRKAVGVLRRLIWFYAEVVANRRAGDRQYKRRSSQRDENDRLAIDMPLDGKETATPSDGNAQFKKIALRVARALGYQCEFSGAEWDARCVSDSPKVVVLDITCPARGFAETLSVSRKDLTAIAEKVRQESEGAMD